MSEIKKVVLLQNETMWSLDRVARCRSAKPFTPVRIWKRPQRKGDRERGKDKKMTTDFY